jgi:outer membrane protein OmpA-like peptidoglycan-associated protein
LKRKPILKAFNPFYLIKSLTLAIAFIVLVTGCSILNESTPAPVVSSKPSTSTPEPVLPQSSTVPTKPKGPHLIMAKDEGDIIEAMRSLRENEVSPLSLESVGYYMDVQYANLQQKLSGLNITTVRNGSDILITIPGSLMFDSNSSALNAFSEQPLLLITDVLTEYYKTLVIVEGHADNQGDADYNLSLSEKRALAVGDYFFKHKVKQSRLLLMGFGSSRPLSSNQSDEGRAANRRIELIVKPLMDKPLGDS